MPTARAVVVALLLALAGLGVPAVALAATPASGPAYLRLAHLSPDTPTVDVYVDSAADPSRSFVVPGVGYGVVSQYQPLAPDSYVISMRAAGAAASSPAVICGAIDVVGACPAVGASCVTSDAWVIPASRAMT